MDSTFSIDYSSNDCVKVSHLRDKCQVYRIPYQVLRSRTYDVTIENNFIVYVLLGKNSSGKDVVYVGKSTKGLENRPLSHENKCPFWSYCFVITEGKDSYLNDGVIQYIENELSERFQSIGSYELTTSVTNTDTANKHDIRYADQLLWYAYRMLNVLGLDLMDAPPSASNSIPAQIPAPVTDPSDYSSLNLNEHLDSLMSMIKSGLLNIDPGMTIGYSEKWRYVRFGVPNRRITLAYCVCNGRKSVIEAHIYGIPEWFGDENISKAGPNDKFGKCCSIFVVSNESDARRLISFCSHSYANVKNNVRFDL